MKHLSLSLFFLFAFFFLSGCEKAELTTLEDLRSEAVIWKLDAYIYSPGGGLVTSLLESERTLQFWEGQVQTNGSFCSLSGEVGPVQTTDYDPANQEFTYQPCLDQNSGFLENWRYSINQEEGYLLLYQMGCVDGCAYRYKRQP